VSKAEVPDTGPLRAIQSWVRYAVVPFPAQAIGSGATWEVEGERGVAHYRLAGSEGERALVEFTVRPRGAAVAAAPPLAEGRVTVDLETPPTEGYEVTIRRGAGDATTIVATTK
jgi:hypothetical protein